MAFLILRWTSFVQNNSQFDGKGAPVVVLKTGVLAK